MAMDYDFSDFHTESHIRAMLTYVQRAVTGEKTVYDRLLAPVEAQFSSFIARYVCSPVVFADLDYKLRKKIYNLALFRAAAASVGMLDVVLTPTGLGVVSSNSLAPASAQRAEALRRDLKSMADALLVGVLQLLYSSHQGWQDSTQGHLWLSTPVMAPDFVYYKTYDDLICILPKIKIVFDEIRYVLLGDTIAGLICRASFEKNVPGWLSSLRQIVNESLHKHIADPNLTVGETCYRLSAHILSSEEARSVWEKCPEAKDWIVSNPFRNKPGSSGFFF